MTGKDLANLIVHTYRAQIIDEIQADIRAKVSAGYGRKNFRDWRNARDIEIHRSSQLWHALVGHTVRTP